MRALRARDAGWRTRFGVSVMSTETLTGVDGLVDSAFNELECISEADTPCEGEPAAFMIFHGCMEGYFCRGHYDYHVMQSRPSIQRELDEYGLITCHDCYPRQFNSIEEFVQVFPL